MVTIRCQNKFLGQKNGKCGRVLGIVPQDVIDLLRLCPDAGLTYRCPQCPSEQRWVKISNNKGSIKFETVEQPTDLPKELVFDELEINEQVK